MQIRQSVDFEIFRRSRMKLGVGFQTAVIIWAAGGAGAFLIGLPFGAISLAVSLLIHSVAAWFFRVDQRIIEMYSHYASTPNEYRAGIPVHGEMDRSRSEGFCKDIQI